ncbi:glucarate dehydratase [Pseudonocardia sp. TMWB2A]|uniref:glucarate dehydratase family protein n=1 Tax=Pseudonocardia sp. TMWB2A TaxID=687430 RepID=UPI00307DC8DF
MAAPHRISSVTVTPVAFRDPPLLNNVGVHEPYAIRAVVQVHTDQGLTGLGETYADAAHLDRVRQVADRVVGLDVWDVHALERTVRSTLEGEAGHDSGGTGGMISTGIADRVLSPFEVALLDLQGRETGRPVSALLGGAVRDRVDYSAYLFYKWDAHPGGEADAWGAALDPAGIVAQARTMIDDYGFTAIKLKGGVFEPDAEIAAIRALADEFPGLPLRLDPNAAWSVSTSVRVGRELGDTLEYLEDPAKGIPAMAEVATQVPQPLATNMCVVAFDHLEPGLRQNAVGVILSDHHYWGGLRRSASLARIAGTFGIGLSMHSNSHLGISLAAMTHLAAATPEVTYACDTHWPWKDPAEDVIVDGVFSFEKGALTVPITPGLGVELDADRLGALHEQYLRCGIRNRNDTGYMQSIVPGFEVPTW